MITALYGKCREMGYCVCKGVRGCVDDESVVRPEVMRLAGKVVKPLREEKKVS